MSAKILSSCPKSVSKLACAVSRLSRIEVRIKAFTASKPPGICSTSDRIITSSSLSVASAFLKSNSAKQFATAIAISTPPLTIAQHSASQHLTAMLWRIKHRVFGTFLQREYQRVPEIFRCVALNQIEKESQCWSFSSSCWQCKEAGHGKCWGHRGSWESVACEAIQKGTMPVSMAGPSHLGPWPRNVTSLIFEDVASCPVSEILQPQIIPKITHLCGS